MGGWNDAETVKWWLRFNREHGRYHTANAELAKHAAIGPRPPRTILDVGAGTGDTCTAIRRVCPDSRCTCLEPAAAMREAGRRIVHGPGVHWTGRWPRTRQFDRVVCGAGIWQMQPFQETLLGLANRVAPGGALAFNIPSAYLGMADLPGGGPDPSFAGFLSQFPTRRDRRPARPGFTATIDCVETWLRAAGLTPHLWDFRVRLTLEEYRDWWKIPVLSCHLWPDVDAAERARRIDELAGKHPKESWKWENWTGWTAWKN